MTAMALLINYFTLFILFPRRFNIIATVSIPILFSIAVHIVLYLTGTQTTFYRFWGGFAHIPLYILLSKGDIYQRLFVLTFIMVCVGFQLALASAVSGLFMIPESNEFWLLMLILVALMNLFFFSTIFLYSKRVFARLFFSGNRRELLLYIIGAVFTYSTMFLILSVTFGIFRITLLLFAFWSFFILCFAIIKTNKNAKQRLDAEMAQDIISSGREHYQKINELQQELRIMRHEYKYHLITANQMLLSGDRESAALYLSDLKQQFTKNELPRFCTNTVINALLSGFAERCFKLDIQFKAEVTLPEPLTIPDYDICIVLGNLLENAIRNCEKQKSERVIELSSGFQGGQLSIVTEYSLDGSISDNDRQQMILNNDDDLGIKSIRAVTARYNGEFYTECNDETITVYVLMSF